MRKTDPDSLMAAAIELSYKGLPAPNPHVGCVIAQDGEIVGQGWHEYYGGPHAEAAALREAGERACGATAYVSLEPCNHAGLTGPCTEALIAAGITKVVFACADPNPVASGGAARLRQAGIEVEGGLLAESARLANLRFLRSIELGRPYVILKAAISLDGRIALPSGESKWITGEEARERAHIQRAEVGAVIVGRNTVEKDNPSLTARVDGVHTQPLRVILDPNHKLGENYKVFSDGGKTIRVVRPGLDGLEISYSAHGFDLRVLLQKLSEMGVRSVLVEGGAATLGTYMQADLADRLELFIAPIVLGGGPSWIEGFSAPDLANAPRFSPALSAQLDNGDLHMALDRT